MFNFLDDRPPNGIMISVVKPENNDVKKALTMYKWGDVDGHYMVLAIRDWILNPDKNNRDKKVYCFPEREDEFVKFVRDRIKELETVIQLQRNWRRRLAVRRRKDAADAAGVADAADEQ